MGLWFTEDQLDGVKIAVELESVVYETVTKFQKLGVYDTKAFGRIMTLDDVIQTAEIDEYLYHESLVHVPLFAHQNPKSILIIGGGDGGALREALKHPSVESVTLVDIDEGVIDAAKRFMPLWSTGFEDERANVIIGDGLRFVKESKRDYDVVLVDSTDPEGPGEALFRKEFYKDISGILKDGGIMTVQSEAPIVMKDLVKGIFRRIKSVFPVTKLYTAPMATYPGALWSFTCGSFTEDPETPKREPDESWGLKYYSGKIHSNAFFLSPGIKKDISG